ESERRGVDFYGGGGAEAANQQIIFLNALARAHYRRSIGTRGGAQASAAD
ncbi:hypothetical protein T492DRAFT_860678, partial [Pavlovales sp. CCMP2436]